LAAYAAEKETEMIVDVLKVDGIKEALLGMGLSYGLTSNKNIICMEDAKLADRLTKICAKCAQRGNGEDKFLRMIQIWADVTAPRFWWAEFDTYKVGTVSLSESTMHTLGKRPLEQEDFEERLPFVLLALLNARTCTPGYTIEAKKELLPESFLQRRIVNFNYAVFANMIRQRRNHRLPQWHYFLNKIYYALPFPEFLPPLTVEKGKE
jgi:hypothetical protein